MSRIGTMTVVAAMVVGLTVAQASALSVDSLSIVSSRNRLDGLTAGWAIDIAVAGTGITNVKARNETNLREFPLAFNAISNTWKFDNTFSSLAVFQSIHPASPTNYRIFFDVALPTADEVLVGFAVNEPADYPHITFPAHNAVGVPLNPTYTWDNTLAGLGLYALGLTVRSGSTPVYGVYPEFNTALTSWTPGPLVPGSYTLVVDAHKITGGKPLDLTTLKGDGFTYLGLRGQSNQVDFSTVPEPATMALVGTAVLGLVGLRRRRRMQ